MRIGLNIKKLPTFLVIGTQKGGTTTLQNLLEQHPRVYLPPTKELHYFTLHWQKNIDWYESHYKESKWWQTRGDITPYYMYYPKAAERMKETIPKAKIIILLRDPARRTISQYFHAKRYGFETLSMEKALEEESKRLEYGGEYSKQKHSYIGRSKYPEQIDRIRKYYKEEQLKIIKSEDLFSNTSRILKEVCNFLNLKELKGYRQMHSNKGEGSEEEISDKARCFIDKSLNSTYKAMKDEYGIEWT